jgi:hypothetical protein
VDDTNINSLLDELSSFDFSSATTKACKKEPEEISLNDTNSEQYFLDKSKAIIDAGVNAIQDMTPYIVQGQDAREIDALAKLLASTSQALDTLNKGTLINKKAEKDEQLEKIKIEGKKEIAQLKLTEKERTAQNQNLNVMITSPEDIVKKLISANSNILELENK